MAYLNIFMINACHVENLINIYLYIFFFSCVSLVMDWYSLPSDTSYPTLADTLRLFCHWFVFKAVTFEEVCSFTPTERRYFRSCSCLIILMESSVTVMPACHLSSLPSETLAAFYCWAFMDQMAHISKATTSQNWLANDNIGKCQDLLSQTLSLHRQNVYGSARQP